MFEASEASQNDNSIEDINERSESPLQMIFKSH